MALPSVKGTGWIGLSYQEHHTKGLTGEARCSLLSVVTNRAVVILTGAQGTTSHTHGWLAPAVCSPRVEEPGEGEQ